MELMLMLGLLGVTVLLSCALALVLVSSLAGRLARRLARGGSHALRWERRVKVGTLVLLLLAIGLLAYRAFHPGDAHYLEEFSAVSLRPAPDSARVVERTAPLDQLRGDRCSHAKIALSNADYTRLLAELEADKRLRAGSDKAYEGRHAPQRKSFTHAMPISTEQRLTLQFLGDGRNVEVNICAT